MASTDLQQIVNDLDEKIKEQLKRWVEHVLGWISRTDLA